MKNKRTNYLNDILNYKSVMEERNVRATNIKGRTSVPLPVIYFDSVDNILRFRSIKKILLFVNGGDVLRLIIDVDR